MRFCPNPRTRAVFQHICQQTCCTALLNSPLFLRVILGSSPNFQQLVNAHYATNTPLRPACFFRPQSSEQVALGVSILVEANDGCPECQFAIRVEGGVTIDLGLLNSTVYNEETSTVSIMGGTRWGDVYKTLKPLGIAVPGGRADTVGVGGLLIGGGLSYYANEHGLACDNVVSFEVVLSEGEIVVAGRTSHPDLSRALKGGGNNLGIITRVELRAFQQGPLWGGLIGHNTSSIPQQINALLNFTPKLAEDPRAQLVTIWQHNGNSKANFAASGLQHTLGVENAPIFDECFGLPQTFSTLRLTDIYDLMMETAPPPGKRALFLTLTFENDARVLNHLQRLHEETIGVASSTDGAKSEDWHIITFMQPFLSRLGKVGGKTGDRNILGLERMDKKDHLLFLFFLAWGDAADDTLFHNIGYGSVEKLKEYTREIELDSDFVYMNYAGRDQNPLRGYGEDNLQFLAAVAAKYDPIRVFQTQVPGGFKVSTA
ncbi:hypothetical protein BDW59DRAFT_177049 [Aspergillus cavernicola]|uniref:FAD-binding PCMH-type domain-containing protein n=1 Tax=Aspergillus cavernicola TaxID=176166 RepID=A0ABR4H941_9EURO